MHRQRILARRMAVALFLVAIGAMPAGASNGSGSVVGKDGEAISGVKFNILSAGTNKTPTVTVPTDDRGKTTFDTTTITPGIYNIWYCPDGKTIYAVPNDQKKEPPCPDAVYIGTVPITPNAPWLAVKIGDSPNDSSVTSWISGVNPVTGTPNDSFLYTSGYPGYSIRPDDNNPQTYTVTQTNSSGTTYVKTGVPASQVGTLPFENLTGDGTLQVYSPQTDPSQTVENKQPSGQDMGGNPAASKTGALMPRGEPAKWSRWGFERALERFYNQFAAPSITSNGPPPLGLLAMLNPFVAFAQANPPRVQQISYMLVSTGNSSGEVFSLVVSDQPGGAQAIPIAIGTALEPTGRKLAQPLPPSPPKQPVNGHCLNFHKEPPAPGSLYRIAGAEKQEAYAHVRYIFAAIDTLKTQGRLHPDTDMNEYLDAIRQYAVWTKEEGWNQRQFTENWIERTRKNADYMKVQWTKQMEKTLRQAAPGRWEDIAQVLSASNRAEHAREQVLALAKQGGPWKQ